MARTRTYRVPNQRGLVGLLVAAALSLGAVAVPVQAGHVAPSNSGCRDQAPYQDPDKSWRSFHYVCVSDGVDIAVAVALPPEHEDGQKFPTMLSMSGYPGATNAGRLPGFVNVNISQRGSGCSGGEFELFTDRVGMDGYEVIENFIVAQPWSNGVVGYKGFSFSGLNGFVIAGMTPPHLSAVAVSGLIEDNYRGMSYIGGVQNAGFPVGWTAARMVPDSEAAGIDNRGAGELTQGDPTCFANIASRPPSKIIPLMLASPFDDAWWESTALRRVAADIRAPIHITHAYQDNNTGPSGANLWELIPDETPKRLVLTNGKHATVDNKPAADSVKEDGQRWLDCWLLLGGEDCDEDLLERDERVRLHFETTESPDGLVIHPPLTSEHYPMSDTAWTRLHLAADGRLTASETPGTSGADTYSTHAGDSGSGVNQIPEPTSPDGLAYELEIAEGMTLAGPIAANLWLSSTAPDTDVFVAIADVHPDGKVEYLQRGMLRASHRQLDEALTDRIEEGPYAGTVIRPRHPHTAESLQPLASGEAVELAIEIFPVGHVFREGHRLRLEVRTPPSKDPVARVNTYVPLNAPATNTLHYGEAFPSHVLVPIVPSAPSIGAEPPDCGAQAGLFCDNAAV